MRTISRFRFAAAHSRAAAVGSQPQTAVDTGETRSDDSAEKKKKIYHELLPQSPNRLLINRMRCHMKFNRFSDEKNETETVPKRIRNEKIEWSGKVKKKEKKKETNLRPSSRAPASQY